MERVTPSRTRFLSPSFDFLHPPPSRRVSVCSNPRAGIIGFNRSGFSLSLSLCPSLVSLFIPFWPGRSTTDSAVSPPFLARPLFSRPLALALVYAEVVINWYSVGSREGNSSRNTRMKLGHTLGRTVSGRFGVGSRRCHENAVVNDVGNVSGIEVIRGTVSVPRQMATKDN